MNWKVLITNGVGIKKDKWIWIAKGYAKKTDIKSTKEIVYYGYWDTVQKAKRDWESYAKFSKFKTWEYA